MTCLSRHAPSIDAAPSRSREHSLCPSHRAAVHAAGVKVFVLALLLVPAIAVADERPEAWLFRATPGFGYSWDREPYCGVEGRMFVGGFKIGKFVTPSLLVGGSLDMGFNALPDRGCMLDDSGLRFTIGMVIGPHVDWYPLDRGFHVSASAGFASFDQDDMLTTRGVGASVATGYDWVAFHGKQGEPVRFGFLLQVSALRMDANHATLMPALLFTVGVD